MIPRDEIKIRKKLLEDCRRPEFARLARYTKEVDESTGETVTRASVKFVEAAINRWGNVRVGNVITVDKPTSRRVNVMIQDLETGAEYSREIDIDKTVERAKPGKHEKIISARATSTGQTYVVAATEDDMAAKEAVITSIVVRQLGLRILPADLVAECMDQVAETIAQLDPELAEKSRLLIPPSPEAQKKPVMSRSSALVDVLKQRRGKARARSKKSKPHSQARKAR